MTLRYWATSSSLLLKQSPTRKLPLKTPLLDLFLTLTYTLHHLPSTFPALVNQNFVVLPQWALWGSTRAKINICANAIFQPTPNTQEAPAITTHNLTSRISKLEKLNSDEIATYTSIIARIHSQYFFLHDKIHQLEPGNSDVIIWKIPSLMFVFDFAKVARPYSDPLIEPATNFSSPSFRTHPHGYNFFIKFYPYGIGLASGKCASILFTLLLGDYDNLHQWPFSKLIHIVIRDQLDPLNTTMKTIRPDHVPAYKKPTMSTKSGVATSLFNIFIPQSKLFSETEGILIDGASFIEFL